MKNNCLNCRWSPLWGKDNTYEQCFCEYPRDRIPSGIEYYKVGIVQHMAHTNCPCWEKIDKPNHKQRGCSMKKEKPCTKPHVGCLNCGGGEMKRGHGKITANLRTRIYNGCGGWTITKNKKIVYAPHGDLEYNEYPTLMKFENMARKDPYNDWRAECMLPLRDATYQRRGKNEWVLIKFGRGFA